MTIIADSKGTTTTGHERTVDAQPGGRLSQQYLSLTPVHYDLIYHKIDFTNFVFKGTVHLTGIANRTSSTITLHALDLQLTSASLQQQVAVVQVEDGSEDNKQQRPPKPQSATEFAYHCRNQTVTMSIEEALRVGETYILTIDFVGVLNDLMCGLYRSTYTDTIRGGNTQRIMATTQFEATDARRAFPCIDEPASKATFQLTISSIPNHMTCISNTPMESIHTYTNNRHGSNDYNDDDELVRVMKTMTFQKTPKMPTYLLAWVIGEFDGISKTSNGIVTTVYTVPGKAKQAKFCLETASNCLDIFQDLFHIPYPLTKSDLLAIPDFAAGAMENWGCVTYREAKILVEPESTSESMKRSIARTVCHEIAHQWFGNLVTPEWWTSLYLKEGVARYMEFVGIDALFPEWNAWTEFVQSVYGLAMSLDAMKSSHPVEVEVNHPDEISEIFDSISYAKGASLIRMIASFIGKDNFYEGMRMYLTRHAYGNTVTNDLWKALEEASGQPVVEFMAPWTLKMGYPILLLSDDGTIRIERYLATGSEPGSDTETVWPIPVTAKVEGVDEIQGPWVINGPNGNDIDILQAKINEWSSAGKWFKLNVDQTGFFRVAYGPKQFARLGAVMRPMRPSSVLSIVDRLGLISDSFAAGKAGYASITDSLTLIESFGEHEVADYAVWQELSENLSSLASLFRSESFFGKIQSFLRKIYKRQLHVLGWAPKEGESGRTGTLRATVISILGGLAEDPDVLKTSHEMFLAHRNDEESALITGDLRQTIYHCALRHDEAAVYDELRALFEASTFPEEQRNCLTVMGKVRDLGRHREMLEYVHNSGKVRQQDISMPLGSLSGSTPEGGKQCWEYFQTNFSSLYSRLGSGPMWAACVALSCRGLSSEQEADAVEEFFSHPSRPAGSAKRRLSQSLEVIRTKALRRSRDKAAMEAFFANRS